MPKKERSTSGKWTEAPSPPSQRPPLGQHFLSDDRIVQRIVESLDLSPGDTVLEIGPGRGVMTELLAARVNRVVAVEIDSKLVAHLKERFGGSSEAPSHVEIHQCDILQFPIDSLGTSSDGQKIKVLGNLPYYITSPCLMHLFRYAHCIDEIVVMVQAEVAERMVAGPGCSDYGLLSVSCRYYSDAKLLFPVAPESFSPPPKVNSAIVKMKMLQRKDLLGANEERAFWSFVKASFAQKRKTLFNNLKGFVTGDQMETRLRAAIEKSGASASVRAEELSLTQFAALFHALRSAGGSEK